MLDGLLVRDYSAHSLNVLASVREIKSSLRSYRYLVVFDEFVRDLWFEWPDTRVNETLLDVVRSEHLLSNCLHLAQKIKLVVVSNSSTNSIIDSHAMGLFERLEGTAVSGL